MWGGYALSEIWILWDGDPPTFSENYQNHRKIMVFGSWQGPHAFSMSVRSFWSRKTFGGCSPSQVFVISGFPNFSGGVDPPKSLRGLRKFWGVPARPHTIHQLDASIQDPNPKILETKLLPRNSCFVKNNEKTFEKTILPSLSVRGGTLVE